MRDIDKINREEIFNALRVAADVMNAHILDSELKAMAHRLVRFSGKELFDYIAAIPTANKYFPAGHTIENDIRKARGERPVGLSLDMIEKNEAEIVVSGQSPAKAAAGAALMKATLVVKSTQKEPESVKLDLGGFDDEKKEEKFDIGDF